MNFVHVVGRLAKDPETRFTASGQKLTVLIVASSSFRSGNEETIWWRVTLWGDRWDKMVQHFSKGKPIMVGGEMRKPEMYTDKGGAPQVGSIELTADYVKFVPFGKGDQPEEGQQGSFRQQPQQVKQHSVAAYSEDHSHHGGGAMGGNPGNHGQGYPQDEQDEEPLPF